MFGNNINALNYYAALFYYYLQNRTRLFQILIITGNYNYTVSPFLMLYFGLNLLFIFYSSISATGGRVYYFYDTIFLLSI